MALRSSLASLMTVVLVAFPPPLFSQDITKGDLRTQITTALSVLNPVTGALSGLIDYAISRGDEVLKARLEQANAIIQGAIASLNDVLRNRIDQVTVIPGYSETKLFSRSRLCLIVSIPTSPDTLAT
jgi:hypothetical protein